ncbi:MAG TPA: TonB-dependent receptor [Rhizomicrobium sp.]|nr:TonB-dependent receptor [Rhizomicrobium sp.]
MFRTSLRRTMLASVAFAAFATTAAAGETFNVPGGDLAQALDTYTKQSGVQLMISGDEVQGVRTRGVKGSYSADDALSRILAGTGFVVHRHPSGAIGLARESSANDPQPVGDIPMQLAQAGAVGRSSVETVTVTSSKLGGADVQSVPIAISAFSQEQLTATQTAGGPDLVKNVPNLTFSKTNFTGYNIQIRGIGTQAISVTTDPAVAVSFNDIPFIRNHFFEQEFFDVSQVEVLRGPQGTLYGRNATSGVVNLISAKPTDHWEAMASVDVGNYNNRRLEGMLNIPVLDDKIALRMAGEWTKRDGYSFNEATNKSIDGRDLWSGRITLQVKPIDHVTATFVYEHFDENDDRERSTKQLCQKDSAPAVVNGPAGPQTPDFNNFGAVWLEQGCKMTSLYAPTAFQTPNASAVPFIAALYAFSSYLAPYSDPYGGLTQSPDLRVTDSLIDPHYTAKNDTYEFNVDINVTPDLTLTSQTAYNQDHLYSTEDFNRFNTSPNLFQDPGGNTLVGQDHEYCDPQLGCSSSLVGQDVSRERANQFYQEVRLTSNFGGPLNFVAGGNYMNYKTLEDYFVMSNAISLATEAFNGTFGSFGGLNGRGDIPPDAIHIPFDGTLANSCGPQPGTNDLLTQGFLGLGCTYIDPNPLESINGNGHNYFRSQNPYRLTSWALFGEAYYQLTPEVKLTGGLRFTDDKKSFDLIPSWTLVLGEGYPTMGTVDQEWQEVTGRFNINWTPKVDFTDQTMVYASYAHGYKGGGANPPGVIEVPSFAEGIPVTSPSNQTHPLTFKPEFNDAFELGTKNSLFDGTMTLNADVFVYKYQNYQISQIVDRTSINLNFDATVKGAELESTWEPIPGLRFNMSVGYEDGTLANGSHAIDLMDRTAGHTDWMVVKPFITETSNCILPTAVVNEIMANNSPVTSLTTACFAAYVPGFATSDASAGYIDPVTGASYVANPDQTRWPGYAGFDPATAPNLGEGFDKDLSGNQLPNAPHVTLSLGAQYSMPVSDAWAGTLRGDFYHQSDSFARVFNDRPYDEIHGYSNINLALIFTNQDGWQAMAYVKNVLDTTAITGAFLNSDDSALTTNVFVTDPRLFGIRLTKNW